MSAGLISGNENTVRFTLDPRTKLALVATVCTIMISGRVGGIMTVIHPVLALVPFALLLLSGRVKAAVSYLLAYAAAYSMISFVMPVTSGMISILIGATAGIIYRMMPSLITGYFVVSTTKVSEFNAAMERMHISSKITIPMSVMFRFFPTIKEESATIKDAMHMRGINSLRNPMEMLEYRMVPLLMSVVKIGEELSISALTRGLSGDTKRTNICEIGFHLSDLLCFLLCIACWICFVLHVGGMI